MHDFHAFDLFLFIGEDPLASHADLKALEQATFGAKAPGNTIDDAPIVKEAF